jgi:serine/threonine protein kinase
MATPATAEQLLELVSKSGLVDPPRLQEYARRRAGAAPATPAELADALVREGLLTHFQADQLLGGHFRNFTLSGKYKVLWPLGSGGMGQVFLCEHAVMRRRVAVKLLPPGQTGDAAAVERFHREARAVARLHHPNIVTAHDADRDGNLHFLVMAYIEGPNLREVVKQHGPLPWAQAADYVRQAALGLQHAHEHGLVHRDVKPSNLLVDGAGTVKVLDLGLARFFHDEADDLSRRYGERPLGTTDYVAPEQTLDSHSVDARADIYSLGATLYYLLAGRSPFHGGTPHQKILWHQTRQPQPIRETRAELPAEMAAALERMMAKDPGQRYQTAAEVAKALAPWAQPGVPPLRTEAPATTVPSGDLTPLKGSSISQQVPVPPAEETGSAPGRPGRWQLRGWAVAVWLAAVLIAVGAVSFAVYHIALPDGPEDDRPPQRRTVAANATPRLRLLVPAYFYPGGEGLAEWQRLLKAPAPATVVIIVNAASGPGKAVDPNFARVIDKAQEKGFTLIGYVSTSYAKRPAEEVKEDIDRWVRFYPGVEGIFIDEQASGATDIGYYAALYQYTRKRRGLRLVVANPGTTCAEEYLRRPGADVVCPVESTRPLRQFRPPAWAAGYQAGRFAALLHRVADPGRMKQDILGMADRRLGYCYITDRSPPNPWDRLPGYWQEELAAVQQVNERSERQGP